MEIVYMNGATEYEPIDEQAMAIGFFDGVHRGHQALLRAAQQQAKTNGHTFAVMTFSPHPDEVIRGLKDKKYITPLAEKVRVMKKFGVERMYIVQFDWDFASLSPEQFVERYVVQLKTKHAVIGFDYHYGKKASGNADTLQASGLQYGFGVSVIRKKTDGAAEKISSTLVRQLIADGRMERVTNLLGRPFEMVATIAPQQLHTYSMNVDPSYTVPATGMYEVVMQQGRRMTIGRVMSDGVQMTLRTEELSDWSGATRITFIRTVTEYSNLQAQALAQ